MSRKDVELDAKTPDAFLTWSEKGFKWVEANRTVVISVLSIGLVGGLAWGGYVQYRSWTEKSAAKAIYVAEAKLNKKKEELAKAESDAMTKDKDTGKIKEPPKVDFEASLSESAREVEGAIVKHAQTRAASVAAIDLASLYLSYKKPDLASALLSQVDGGNSETLKSLIQALSATAVFEQGDYNRASSLFEQILQDPNAEFLHPDTMVKLGLCYEKLDQADRAKEMYSRASAEFADSESGRTAKGYLRLLELQNHSKAPAAGAKKG